MAVSFNQLAIYALILVLGWLLGLLSRSGGSAWRRRYEAERDSRLALETAHAERDTAARARIAELERQSPAIGTVVPVTPAGDIRDDLTLVRGLSSADEARLNEAGILRHADLRGVSDAETATIENRLGIAAGTITRQEWREQAALLADGRVDEHRSRFG